MGLRALFISLGLVFRKINFANREIISPLECGFSTATDFRQPVSLRFFIFAVIFVVFDVELILVVPLIAFPMGFASAAWVFISLVLILSLGLLLE